MDGQGGLQLIPDIKRRVEVKQSGQNKPLIVSGIIAGLLVGAGLGMSFYKQSFEDTLAGLDTELQATEMQRDKKAEKDLKIVYGQMNVISQLIKDHPAWSSGFIRLENLFEDQAQILLFGATLSDPPHISIKVIAPNYLIVARQIASLNSDDSITDVSLAKILSTPEGKIEFTMTLKFDPHKFLKI